MSTPGFWLGNRMLLFRILLPAFATLALFIVSIYQIIIPRFEGIILDRKREMIRELVNSSWHVADRYYQEERLGTLTAEQAQQLAIDQLRLLRYGEEGKDYFWVSDFQPMMIVHPFREDLNGKDLTDFKDSQGKRLFVEIAAVGKAKGEGFVDYTWQWKDDSTRVVPKLSFVKVFAPWGWIIGTGIYLEDVRAEIASLERNVITISVWITIAISLLLLLIAVQNLRSERRRLKVEQDLREAKEKYQALVEASTEGLLMMLEGEQMYLNKTMLSICGYAEAEVVSLTPQQLLPDLDIDERALTDERAQTDEREQTFTEPHIETGLRRKDGSTIPVLLSMSRVSLFGKTAIVVIVEDVSKRKKVPQQDTGQLIVELQEPLIFLSQPIDSFVREIVSCRMSASLDQVAQLLSRTGSETVFVSSEDGTYIGMLTGADVFDTAVSQGEWASRPAYEAMVAPIFSIKASSTVFDVLSAYADRGFSSVAVKDDRGRIFGSVSVRDVQRSELKSYLFFLQRLSRTKSVAELRQCTVDLRLYLRMLVESGAGLSALTHATTLIHDAVAEKLLALAIAELGPAPAPFAFIALGSQGRSEAALAADQDNAIIYADIDAAESASTGQYFSKLGAFVCDGLDTAGFPYCPGDVMAKNEKWCQPLSSWKQYFLDWVNTANPEDLLDVSIFFDFRHVAGDASLTDALRDHLFNIVSGNNAFFVYLAQNAARIKLPTWQFKAADFIDVKVAILPLVELARIYALKHGVRPTNTQARFLSLRNEDVFTASGCKDLTQAFSFLMNMRFRHQAELLSTNTVPDNAISTHDLGEIEKAMLRRVLSQVEDFRTKLSLDFKGTI